jgi:hypothetical protein
VAPGPEPAASASREPETRSLVPAAVSERDADAGGSELARHLPGHGYRRRRAGQCHGERLGTRLVTVLGTRLVTARNGAGHGVLRAAVSGRSDSVIRVM